MAVYMFTFHAYATWMPDRPQGYVHHDRGWEPRSPALAGSYRNNQREAAAQFDEYIGTTIIDTVQTAARHLDCTVHAVTVDPSHIHILISWRHVRSWQSMRTSLKSAISRALNTHHTKRTWLSKGASRKRIRDQKHFDHHILHYLPSHVGCSWFRDADVKAARKRVERVP